jgi:alpha-glucosidase
LAILLACVCGVGGQARDVEIASPDGRLVVRVQDEARHGGMAPRWSVAYRGQPLLGDSRLGLGILGKGDLLQGATITGVRERVVRESIPMPHGRARLARNHFREGILRMETPKGGALQMTFRCYDDAIALRYLWSGDAADSLVTVTNEDTSFVVAGEPAAYVQYLENERTSHEHEVRVIPAPALPPGQLLDLPLTLQWANGTVMAITEASLRHYAGMGLERRAGDGAAVELACHLTARADGNKVVRQGRLETPWRVVLVGDRPGALLESTTLYCLNEPSVLSDTAWIRPGKITFHWWNGDVFDGKPGPPMLSMAMNRAYIDFCAAEGIPTHSITSTEGVTSPWYHQSIPGVAPGPDTDVTRPRDDFDLESIRNYADRKGVRLWTWVHQAALRGRVEEAFAAFERMGWTGLMVDFFDHDDQEHVEFAEEVLEAAGRHHLLVQLHGIWKPTGLERTFPNLVNHEGALNLEYLKWSDRCTPEHDLRMAFTRLVAGPMDYHLGGFRAVPRSAFVARAVAPTVLGTRGHQLAMYVCFDNPNPMLADYPTAYLGQPGFEFLKEVPTWWDETRVLVGEIGEVLVSARRRGRTWYLGGLSAHGPRVLDLPLDFLGTGSYRVRLWKDGPDTGTDPNSLAVETRRVTARDSLKIGISRDGGFVARLIPEAQSVRGAEWLAPR